MRQDTPEWHAWRAEGIGASEAAIILGVSPWKTPHQLWLEKTGRAEPPAPTQAMLRGKELEPIARAAYESAYTLVMQPATLEHPEWPVMRCSVDGITLDGDCVVEIKCPGYADHQKAVNGEVPAHYMPQCQHILAVTQAPILHYWSWGPYGQGSDVLCGFLVEVFPSSAYIATLMNAEKAFWQLVVDDVPPALTDRDVVARTDASWVDLATDYRHWEAVKSEAASKVDAIREALSASAGSAVRVAGGGITLTRYTREGNVNYKAIPELRGVDLDQYRGKSTQAFRVSIDKA